MKVTVLWNTASCSLAAVDRRFTRAYCVYHQGFIALMMDAVRISETSATPANIYGAIYQKTLVFIVDTVRTLNHTQT